MDVLKTVGNYSMDFFHGMCPTGVEAGEVGPYYAFLFYLLAPTAEIGSALVSLMMVGYTARLAEVFVNSIPRISLQEQSTLFVDSKGIATFDEGGQGIQPKPSLDREDLFKGNDIDPPVK